MSDMTTTTTPTVERTAADMLDAILSGLNLRDDPALRHYQLAEFSKILAAMQREVARRKAECAAELADAGLRHHEVAEVLGLKRSRAQQLVQQGRTRPPR